MTDSTKAMFNSALNSGEIVFWEDPGHGWLQVPIKLVNTLVKEEGMKVSKFSYEDDNYAYLEEDCDASAFIKCFPWVDFRQVFGVQIQRSHQENIFIRNLNRF